MTFSNHTPIQPNFKFKELKMVTKSMKAVVECLYCGEDIQIFINPKSGSFITCNKCSSQFEIIDLEPVTIDWPYYDDDYVDDDDAYYDYDSDYD
jgi:transcription elongation factor Elf1